MGKTFLGISYILQGIPYVNLIGFILVPIAWLVEGFRERKGLWISAGISGLVSFGLIGAGLASVIHALHLFQLIRSASTGMSPLSSNALSQDLMNAIHGGNPALLSSLLIVAAGFLLGFIYFILMLVSIFQAGSMYSSVTLKVGGILYIIDVILAGVVFALAVIPFAAHPTLPLAPQLLTSLGAVYVTSIIAAILALAASIVIGIGFLVIHEKSKAPETLA